MRIGRLYLSFQFTQVGLVEFVRVVDHLTGVHFTKHSEKFINVTQYCW